MASKPEKKSTSAPKSAATRDLPLVALREGMTLLGDLRMTSGVLLAAEGYVVTRAFVERARNFPAGAVVEPVTCRLPGALEGGAAPLVERPAA